MYHFSPSEVQALKRLAKAYKKRLNYSTSKALDHVANQNGYNNWSLLQKHSLKQEDSHRPARVLDTEKIGDYTVQRIPVVRVTSTPHPPYQLIYRCPNCKEVHGITDGGHHFGAGDGYHPAPCYPKSPNLIFDFEETKNPTEAGALPANMMKLYVSELIDDDIKGWFAKYHSPATEESPRDGKDGGYMFPTMEGVWEIHAALCDKFPYIDEDRLYSIAEGLDNDNVWLEGSFDKTREKNLLLEPSAEPRKSSSEMSKEELDLYSDMHNPNNDANMDDWAEAHNPNNKRYINSLEESEKELSDEELYESSLMAATEYGG